MNGELKTNFSTTAEGFSADAAAAKGRRHNRGGTTPRTPVLSTAQMECRTFSSVFFTLLLKSTHPLYIVKIDRHCVPLSFFWSLNNRRDAGLFQSRRPIFTISRSIAAQTVEEPLFERKPSISLKNLSPVSVCTPPRQAVSLPRVVTIYPSAAAQIAMAGQAKGVDFKKD